MLVIKENTRRLTDALKTVSGKRKHAKLILLREEINAQRRLLVDVAGATPTDWLKKLRFHFNDMTDQIQEALNEENLSSLLVEKARSEINK
ncbi:hypothetical protein IMZ31_20160 (plasmid) [Pontibacillus sp. ALD_SL1]|uniref:hypothetical protein n=1 Tax=Pontibacillus sp. ALD_SL1 TaxID=2777185 RepID=UPI001A974FD9|nr:hypothetical protein [Pontibacillus sp. ALD_SL1]QST02866.1 hypothetical protein IMZ31_20160 [Pontibacillus sp. ALD_SL1]